MKHPVDAAWERGRAETLTQSLQNLMKNLGWTLDKAMDALSIPDGERPKYAVQLEKM